MADEKPPSTRALIAEAESLRSAKGDDKELRTRQLVAESERLIGRAPARSYRGLIVVVVLAIALIAGAAIFLMR